MAGAIVTGPKGWKKGPPVYSPEGCYYPTWVRDQPKAKRKKRTTRKHKASK